MRCRVFQPTQSNHKRLKYDEEDVDSQIQKYLLVGSYLDSCKLQSNSLVQVIPQITLHKLFENRVDDFSLFVLEI